MNANKVGAPCATTQAPTKEKHIELDDSIDRLELVIDSLIDLRDRIEGCDVDKNVKGEPCPTRSLAMMLSGAPSDIDKKREIMNDLIRQLNDLLFG